MGATDTEEREIADLRFGSGSPGTWYVGLSLTTPNDDGTNFTEPSGGSYARKAVTNNTTNFPDAVTTSGVTTKTNGAKITFNNPTATWGLVTHYGIFTTSTGGTPRYTNPLNASITIQNGNTPVEFDIGQLALNWD